MSVVRAVDRQNRHRICVAPPGSWCQARRSRSGHPRSRDTEGAVPLHDSDGVALCVAATPANRHPTGTIRPTEVRRDPAGGPLGSRGSRSEDVQGSGPPEPGTTAFDPLHPRLKRRLERGWPGRISLVFSLCGEGRDPHLDLSASPIEAPGLPAGRDLRTLDPRPGTAELERALERVGGAVVERFRLLHAVAATLPTAALPEVLRIAGRRIAYVEPTLATGRPPRVGPAPAPAHRSVGWARERLGSEPYRRLGLREGRIALLDTDVRMDHALLAGTGRIRRIADCSDPGLEVSPRRRGTVLGHDHGTASAAILSGGDALGPDHRGVTEIPVDCHRVYDAGHSVAQLDLAAAVRAFERAMLDGASVIVAQVQGASALPGVLNRAADLAYRAGAVVLAAGGNQPGEVPAPAAARGCLAVGGIDCRTGDRSAGSRGPTPDGRVKPDLLALTGTRTACARGPEALAPFHGTSGATPYAAGAAALIRTWALRVKRREDPNARIEPGEVYALLLLSSRYGSRADDPAEPGSIHLPGSGTLLWGRITVRPDEAVTIGCELSRAAEHLEAVIWYGEPDGKGEARPEPPDRIRLGIRRLDGRERARSAAEAGVFQHVGIDGRVEPGGWNLRLEPLHLERARAVFLAARIA